ncbi:hypothetical protein MHB69_12900 [Bacillus sp. FSL K6-0994]|uniref:hypothetical protein n=1 Tax=Bacillus sp. FSL K6-0994 TaxID=2921457 RepID=UPI00315AA491
MDQELTIALIQGAVTIIVGLMTAAATYIGVRFQIKKNEVAFERKREKEDAERKLLEQEDIDFRKKIIERFIDQEIKVNFREMKNDSFEKQVIYGNLDYASYSGNFSDRHFNFNEFEKVKYDLIKYKDEKLIEVIEIYDAFRLIVNYSGFVRRMNRDEFRRFRKGYQHCLNRY